MSDLISREEALKALEWKWAGKAALDAIKALPSAELQGKCNGCFYLDSNGATCEFCARNYPDRYSAKTEGEQNERLNKQTGCN